MIGNSASNRRNKGENEKISSRSSVRAKAQQRATLTARVTVMQDTGLEALVYKCPAKSAFSIFRTLEKSPYNKELRYTQSYGASNLR